MEVFTFNNQTNRVEINDEVILLVKEFATLFNDKRNKTKADPTGVKKTRAFREFTYIYLMLDWKSIYSDYFEQERHLECLKDADLTEEEFNDPDFRAACRKYREIQESNRSIKMLGAAQDVVDKFIDYFRNIDPEERDPVTFKPLYKVKDIMAEVKGLSELHDNLKSLEIQVKKEQEEATDIRGGAIPGFNDD